MLFQELCDRSEWGVFAFKQKDPDESCGSIYGEEIDFVAVSTLDDRFARCRTVLDDVFKVCGSADET